MNQLLSSPIWTLQDKVNALYDVKEFYDPETASSSGMSHVLSQPLRIPSPEVCSAAILDCCIIHGIRRVLQDENRRVQQYRLHDFPGILMPGIPRVVLEELVLKIVRWKLRGMLSRYCISENSQTKMTFTVGESTSRPKCA